MRDTSSPRLVGVIGAEVSRRLEPLAHQYLSLEGPTVTCERIQLEPDRYDLFEDFLEHLAKEGMLGVHVVWPNRSYASERAEWHESAAGAGCVDTLAFRDRGDRVPLGANVTVASFVDLFSQFGVEPLGTTLVYGAGHTARSLISALQLLGASKVLVYDPRHGRSNKLVANVQASNEQRGLVEAITDPAAAFEIANGFADCLNPAAGPRLEVPDDAVGWWFDGPGRRLDPTAQTTQLLPGWCLSVHRAAHARWLWLDEEPKSRLVEHALTLMSEALRDADPRPSGEAAERP